jgi:hypothetical protein
VYAWYYKGTDFTSFDNVTRRFSISNLRNCSDLAEHIVGLHRICRFILLLSTSGINTYLAALPRLGQGSPTVYSMTRQPQD